MNSYFRYTLATSEHNILDKSVLGGALAEYAYTTVPGKISNLLTKIREIGVPPKASSQWLKTIGFTSSNDTSLIGVLKQIGLVDPSGVPTSTWTKLRGARHKEVLGSAIRTGYADLFAVYPNAEQRNVTELEHVFSTSSTAGKQVIGKTVSTFKALCELATFSEESEPELNLSTESIHQPVQARPSGRSQSVTPNNPSVHIDIQVHIAPESTPEQIDQIFKSMAKHLYGKSEA